METQLTWVQVTREGADSCDITIHYEDGRKFDLRIIPQPLPDGSLTIIKEPGTPIKVKDFSYEGMD